MKDLINICGFCKGSTSDILYNTLDLYGASYSINKCIDCKAYFLAPRPDNTALEKVYDSAYYGEKENKFNFPVIEKALDYFRKGRARRLSGFLANHAKILDIGCGNGKFLQYLSTYGDFGLYGTELDGNSAERTKKIPQITLKTGQLKKNDFKPHSFDAITMFHVFEHLTEPEETLDIIGSVLKDNGILVISCPNITSFQSSIFKGKWLHLDPPRHLFFFDPDDLVNIMKKYGFRLIKKRYMSLEQNPFGMTQSILNCVFQKREILFERLKGNTKYAKEYPDIIITVQKAFFILTFPLSFVSDIFESLFKKGATVEFTFRKNLL